MISLRNLCQQRRWASSVKSASSHGKEIVQVVRRGESSIITRLTMRERVADKAPTGGDVGVWKVTRQRRNDGEIIIPPSGQGEQDAAKMHAGKSIGSVIVHRLQASVTAVKNTLIMTFLPKSYPDSVSPDYLPYTLWHFAHCVSGTITGTLSTQALLQALGMGLGTSIGLAATTNWIIKDGFGLLGGVLYAAFFGSRFDSQARRYRFLAALSIQAATLAELLTPLVPQLFLPMASLSNVGKNVGWLAASATKASMHKGFARGDNLGDITAKSGAQATLAGLVGTTGGIAISWAMSVVSGGAMISPWTMFYAFAPLSLFNLWSAYKANMAVVTRSLNVERGELALRNAVVGLTSSSNQTLDANAVSRILQDIPTPVAISKLETFVMPYKSSFKIPLEIEPDISRAVASIDRDTAEAFWDGVGVSNYRIHVSTLRPVGSPVQQTKVCLWFLEGSSPEDHIKGFLHACMVRLALESGVEYQNSTALIVETRKGLDISFAPIMQRLMENGWMTEYTHIADRNARINFKAMQ
ncbi:hypothetical protein HDU97_000507 [Phlyctochytrium planicorne]|nr:hypothetical protein HDU97_000507 [Phlyctochytrium planicorne]